MPEVTERNYRARKKDKDRFFYSRLHEIPGRMITNAGFHFIARNLEDDWGGYTAYSSIFHYAHPQAGATVTVTNTLNMHPIRITGAENPKMDKEIVDKLQQLTGINLIKAKHSED